MPFPELSSRLKAVLTRDTGFVRLGLGGPGTKTFTEPPFWAQERQSLTLLPRTNFDYKKQVGDGLGSSVLMAAIAWIQRTFPEAPLELIKAANEEVVTDQADLRNLLRRPNDFVTMDDLWSGVLYSRIVDGNGYLLKIRDTVGRRQLPWNENVTGNVRQLWYAPHWMLEPKGTATTLISHYEYLIRGEKIKVAPQNVIHFRNGIDPRNPRKGLSEIESELREIFTDDEVANYTASILKNMGIPGLVISPDGDASAIPPEAQDAIKAAFIQKFTRDRRGEPLVTSGAVKVSTFGFDPKQMDVSNLGNRPEERICAKLGIPAAVVGFGTGMDQTKVGATMTELIRLAWTGCLIPRQKAMAAQLSLSLLPEFAVDPDAYMLHFNHRKVSALAEVQKITVDKAAVAVAGGFLTVAGAQELCGLPVDPTQRVYLRSLQSIEVLSGEKGVLPTLRNVKGSDIEERVIASAAAAVPSKEQRQLIAELNRDALVLEITMEAELQDHFAKAGERIANAVLDVLEPGRPKAGLDDESLTQAVMNLLDISALKNDLGLIYGAHYFRVAQKTVDAVTAVMGLAVSLPDQRARDIMAAGGRRAGLVDLEKQTRERLFRELTLGRSLGEGPEVLARRIREFVPAGPWSTTQVRARMIARTETLHAQRLSTLEAYRGAENVTAVMVFDNRTGYGDADCAALDGRIVSLTDAWQLMDAEHPAGTRAFAPVIGSAA